MKNKNKVVTIAIILTTLVLAGVAIFTAIRLYQTRNVAPTESEAGSAPSACQLTFTIVGPTATATSTSAPGCNTSCTTNANCPTGYSCWGEEPGDPKVCRKTLCKWSASCVCPTSTATTTATATATARTVVCNQVCNPSINPPINCISTLTCHTTSTLRGASGLCRNEECLDETDCGCPGATETPTTTPTVTATATATDNATATATATATSNPECNNNCTENTDCPDGLMCNIPSGSTTGSCRNTSCLSETDCLCPVATATATATSLAEEPNLPDAGTSWPTILGSAFGILIILGSLLLAF